MGEYQSITVCLQTVLMVKIMYFNKTLTFKVAFWGKYAHIISAFASDIITTKITKFQGNI